MIKGNVLYVGGFELPDKNAAAHRVLSNAKILRTLGFNVVLAGLNKDSNSIQKQEVIQGFKSYEMKYPSGTLEWAKYLISVKDVIKILKKEDVTHIICYNYPSSLLYRLLKYSKTRKIKLYADCTEWYEPSGNLLHRVIKGVDVNFRMKYLHLKLDGLIVISDYLLNFYKDKGIDNIINIPPLVDFTETKWDSYETNKLKSKEYNFVYSGSPGTGNKDRLDIIIECLKNFYVNENKNLTFDVIGITKVDYVKHFNSNIELNSDYDFVDFHGRITHVESLKLSKKADFSIFFREMNLTNIAGFPTKFVESISAGTPVITNNSSNIEKYFTNENSFMGYLIKELSVEQINRVLESALSLNKETINSYKIKCEDSKFFDYNKHVEPFGVLMSDSL